MVRFRTACSLTDSKDRGAILSVEAKTQGGILRPLSAPLIILYTLPDNKFFCEALVQNTENLLHAGIKRFNKIVEIQKYIL